jgi:hypothetical protein
MINAVIVAALVIARTASATPAFIKELVRKAAVDAAEDVSNDSERLPVRDEHFEAALREMTLGTAGLTRRIFGFSPAE